MTAFDDDETFERELFAVRAKALAAPTLSLERVLSQVAAVSVREASQPRGRVWTAWLAAAACAAAVCAGIVTARPTKVYVAVNAPGHVGVASNVNIVDHSSDEPAVCAVAHETDILACVGSDFSHAPAPRVVAFAPVDFVVGDGICGTSSRSASLMCEYE